MFDCPEKKKATGERPAAMTSNRTRLGVLGLVIGPRLASAEIYRDPVYRDRDYRSRGGGRVGKQRFRSCHRLSQ
jgi:hypothetical protein